MKNDEVLKTPIDEYILQFEENIQNILFSVRDIIKKNAPSAIEKISWKMPTFYLNENLIHFAAHKKHIGIYPGVEAIEFFEDKLKIYKTSKGAIQFPINKPMPFELITEIVKFRVAETTK